MRASFSINAKYMEKGVFSPKIKPGKRHLLFAKNGKKQERANGQKISQGRRKSTCDKKKVC